MAIAHQGNQSRPIKPSVKIAAASLISVDMAFYVYLRWGASLFMGAGIFIAGSLILYFSIGLIFTEVKNQLASGKIQKAYTIKSIIYLMVVWVIVLASGRSLWVFKAQHEISICPGWSNDVEETSNPVLVKVTNQGIKEDIPLSKFRDKDQKQYFLYDGKGLEIRDCVFYQYSDSRGLERVSFQFLRGKEYLPVQVTGNDAGAVLDLESGGGDWVKIAISPLSRYNLTTMNFLQYFIRWASLLCLAAVFSFYSLLAVRYLVSYTTKLFDPGNLPAHSQLIFIQSGMIAVWFTRNLKIRWYLFALVWLSVTIVNYVMLSVISHRIKPASADASTHGKVIIFAFYVSVALTLFIPLQPKDSFGIYSSSPLPNVIYNGYLIGKVAVLDLFVWAIFLILTNTQRVFYSKNALSRRWIVLYAFPMMAVGFVMLLAFWPGVMNQDSLDQWMQIKAFEFDLQNPIFHTLLNWLITRVWVNPAAVVIAQILGLSLTTGYVLYRLEKAGVPKLTIAIAAVIAAFVPPNEFYVVMLCKDVPYAITCLWVTVLLFEIFYSNGQWIMNNLNMTLLGLTITGAILLRYNGLFEMIVLMVLLLVVYRNYWRRWMVVGLSSVALMTFANFAFDQYLPKPAVFHEKAAEGAVARMIEHRVRAHIYSGTEIQQPERNNLSKVLPSMAIFDTYNCHDSPLYQEYYASASMLLDPQNLDELIRAYVPLVFRSPLVEVRHQICNLSIFFRVLPRTNEFQELVPVRINAESGKLIYQVTPALAALAGVSQDSKIPPLARILGEYMSKVERDKSLTVAPWRAASYIFAILIGLGFHGLIYEKDWRFLIIGGVVLAHLAVFAFGNVFSIFRFHLMILPIACVLWPLLFLRGRIRACDEEQS
jgi:hypothetical protein